MKPREGQLSRSQIEWLHKWVPAFAKAEPQASASEADTAAYRARYQEQLTAQKTGVSNG